MRLPSDASASRVAIDADARALDVGQDADERFLELDVDRRQPLAAQVFLEARPERERQLGLGAAERRH
jgi:hypothetical protein